MVVARDTCVAWLKALWPGLVVLVVIVWLGVMSGGLRLGVFEEWERTKPLARPIAVVDVRDGVMTLADGRVLRPAGVVRRETVSAEEYDRALRVIVAQGVEVTREVGEGRAFLVGEPKFFIGCGTSVMRRSSWLTERPGAMFRSPLSEYLVVSGYAKADLDQTGLTARERWRLEGVGTLVAGDEPARITSHGAMWWNSWVRELSDPGELDLLVECLWKPPPAE